MSSEPFPIVNPPCNDCGYHLTFTGASVDGMCGNWLGEDDTYGCAGRGDPNAEPAEVFPHRPTFIEGPLGTFTPQHYAVAPFGRDV